MNFYKEYLKQKELSYEINSYILYQFPKELSEKIKEFGCDAKVKPTQSCNCILYDSVNDFDMHFDFEDLYGLGIVMYEGNEDKMRIAIEIDDRISEDCLEYEKWNFDDILNNNEFIKNIVNKIIEMKEGI